MGDSFKSPKQLTHWFPQPGVQQGSSITMQPLSRRATPLLNGLPMQVPGKSSQMTSTAKEKLKTQWTSPSLSMQLHFFK